MLVLVIILFTLLTVEFRMHSRAEEIEIMQLVGGSLGYIRMPFVIEGGIYGFLGAMISNSMILGLILLIQRQLTTGELEYLQNIFGRLDWPQLGIPELAGIFLIIALIGLVIGAVNSYIAILRYIK
jgi:cell division transport system permease protein